MPIAPVKLTCCSCRCCLIMKPSYLISISKHSFSILDKHWFPKPCLSRTLYSTCGFLRRLSNVDESFTGWPDNRETSAARSPPTSTSKEEDQKLERHSGILLLCSTNFAPFIYITLLNALSQHRKKRKEDVKSETENGQLKRVGRKRELSLSMTDKQKATNVT